MSVTPETSILDYARSLARKHGLTVVITKAVSQGQVCIDDRTGTVSVCPGSSRHTLRMNANGPLMANGMEKPA